MPLIDFPIFTLVFGSLSIRVSIHLNAFNVYIWIDSCWLKDTNLANSNLKSGHLHVLLPFVLVPTHPPTIDTFNHLFSWYMHCFSSSSFTRDNTCIFSFFLDKSHIKSLLYGILNFHVYFKVKLLIHKQNIAKIIYTLVCVCVCKHTHSFCIYIKIKPIDRFMSSNEFSLQLWKKKRHTQTFF